MNESLLFRERECGFLLTSDFSSANKNLPLLWYHSHFLQVQKQSFIHPQNYTRGTGKNEQLQTRQAVRFYFSVFLLLWNPLCSFPVACHEINLGRDWMDLAQAGVCVSSCQCRGYHLSRERMGRELPAVCWEQKWKDWPHLQAEDSLLLLSRTQGSECYFRIFCTSFWTVQLSSTSGTGT